MATTSRTRRHEQVFAALLLALLALGVSLFAAPTEANEPLNRWEELGDGMERIESGDPSSAGSEVASNAAGDRVALIRTDEQGENSVLVYELSRDEWVAVGGVISAPNGAFYGEAISLTADGNRLALIEQTWTQLGVDASIVVYDFVDDEWLPVGSPMTVVEDTNNSPTLAMSADGMRVFAGSDSWNGEGVNGTSNLGAVHTFEFVGDDWVSMGPALRTGVLNDSFGFGLATNSTGSRIAVGLAGVGSIQTFDWTGASWEPVGERIEEVNRGFGFRVALTSDGSRLVASSPSAFQSIRSGKVRVYELMGDSWVQIGDDLSTPSSEDGFGWSLGISDSGTRIAVGAQSGPTGFIGVFDDVNGTWRNVGGVIAGEAVGAAFGNSLALSADGQRVIGGGPGTGALRESIAHVRAYELVSAATCDGRAVTILGTAGRDELVGTVGADVIVGLQGNDDLRGLAGNDIICGGAGDDLIVGGAGFDVLFGAQGNDQIVAADGSDVEGRRDSRGARMFGGAGDDVIFGSNRWDRMQGGEGNDKMFGFEGRDRLRGGGGIDALNGGPGADDLGAGGANDTIWVTRGDTVHGGPGLRDQCLGEVATAATIRSCERRANG